MNRKSLVVVVGPTAIGKTGLSLSLAKHFQTEILSADSRQFFKEMSIGTAAPTKAELQTAPHHFIHHKSISEEYSVGDFEKDAIKKLKSLFQEHNVVVLVGGSGLYVDAVIKGLDHFPEIDQKIRIKLNAQLATTGILPLQEQLKDLDPNYYSEVDLQNPHRLIRALEICIGTGKPYSSFRRKNTSEKRIFDSLLIGLTAERELVYDRINRRVDLMMEEGLLEEAKSLYPYKNLNALNTVGYKELFRYFEDHLTLDQAVGEIKKNTRRFAKRQYTWFNKNEQIQWFDHDTPQEEIIRFLEEKML